MHVFDRRANEALLINGCIEVKVLEVNEQTVRISITSPNDTPRYQEFTVDVTEKSAVLELLNR
jgi:carbon storage regulator CsrA